MQFLKPNKSFNSSTGFTKGKRQNFVAWATPGPAAYTMRSSFGNAKIFKTKSKKPIKKSPTNFRDAK